MKKWQLILLLLNLENLAVASEQARAAAKAIKDFICSYEGCGKNFARKADFNGHERIHTGEKPYVCDTCGKGFTYSGNLARHERIHTGEKPYVCNTCGKGFANSSNLARHKRIHSGEKPYVCGFCGKSFANSSDLIKHKRIHTGERPYVCNTCDMKFTHMSSLINHKRIHSGEKPYFCDICDIKFTQMSSLTNHKQRIHAQKASVDKKRPRDVDIVEFEDPGLLDDLLVPGGAGGVDGLASADLGLDDALAQSLFDDSLELEDI